MSGGRMDLPEREQAARAVAKVWLWIERDDEWADVDGYDRDRCFEAGDAVLAINRGAVSENERLRAALDAIRRDDFDRVIHPCAAALAGYALNHPGGQ